MWCKKEARSEKGKYFLTIAYLGRGLEVLTKASTQIKETNQLPRPASSNPSLMYTSGETVLKKHRFSKILASEVLYQDS
jgi:hypothetical protein